jgi:hypothetical protein
LKSFNRYINEALSVKEIPMFFSSELVTLLKSIDSNISKELLEIPNSGKYFPISYATTQDIDFFSVLPVNRIGRLEGVTDEDLKRPSKDSAMWGDKFRQPVRIGAFVGTLLPKYKGSKDLENFVHQIKAKLDESNYELKIVRGEEIRKWYLVSNYYNSNPGFEEPPDEGILDIRSPLMKSCLKQPEKQDFFDIYCDNPEQVGMLIMLNFDKKLVARAVIWFDCIVVENPENPPHGVLMDRIYYTNESDVNIFIDYAKQHGWWYKPTQAKEIYSFVMNGEITNKQIYTKLKNHGVYAKYPYMDTMCFYTPFSGRLSSYRGKPAKIPKGLPGEGEVMDRFQLQSARGGAKRLLRDK